MFVKNPIAIDRKAIFPCKSSKLYKFLVKEKKIPFITRVLDQKDNKYIWCFMRTEALGDALLEWKNNKEEGKFIYGESAN